MTETPLTDISGEKGENEFIETEWKRIDVASMGKNAGKIDWSGTL